MRRAAATAQRATTADWIRAARPATLGLAFAPVALGAGAADYLYDILDRPFLAPKPVTLMILAVLLAFALQIGVNFANDYSDGIRGTDARRVGPARLVGSGAAAPKTVLRVALVFFGAAAVIGIAITVITGLWWLLAVGAAAIVAAWFYTGGKRPYGYFALGELVVFVFFGLVATTGTAFIITGEIWLESILLGIAQGFFAMAVLLINNMRDRATDIDSGKRTLSVRIGVVASRVLFASLVLLPYVILLWFAATFFLAPFVYFTLVCAVPTVLIGVMSRSPKDYILALKLTVITSLLFAVSLAAALAN